MKLKLIFIFLCGVALPFTTTRADTPNVMPDPATLYRQLTLAIRTSGNFQVPMPARGGLDFSYELQFAAPKFAQPLIGDFYLNAGTDKFVREFWDKVLLKDGSFLSVDGQQIPLTCVFIRGQDNRFSGKDTPLTPDFILKVYLVANDFTCTGPINPGWPANGGKKETWDTYFYFEIRDPTIMLPTEGKIRYRWSEFPAILVNPGA
jgi:hypothetical protein